jgi:mono/diheme cytochrome c family protein
MIAGVGSAGAQPVSPDEGLRIFKSANCVGCHKWTGEGGGGYGGAAANLRRTKLSFEQIEETVRCGRPMTGMPHFEAEAYADGHCFGLKKSDIPASSVPPEPDHPLRPADIKTVATYVVTWIKGKGDPDYAQCQAFFGTGSRVCNTYPREEMASAPAGPEASGGHMKVEQAADANAPTSSK